MLQDSTKDLKKMTMPINLLEKSKSNTKPKPVNLVEDIILEAYKKVRFGTTFNNAIKEELINLLKSRITTFAQHLKEVTGVDPGITTHKLNVDTSIKLIQQKKRKFTPERQWIVKDEINKLLNA